MMWILGGLYCLVIWLVFAKWRLMRLSLPLAIILASVGPALILGLLFCAQYYHPYTSTVVAFRNTVPITPQVSTRVRVTQVHAQPSQRVRMGDLLFELDKVPLQAAVDQATAELDAANSNIQVADSTVFTARATVKRAEADLAFVEGKRDRESELVQRQAVSQQEFEQTLAAYQQAASGLDEARATENQAVLGVALAKTRRQQAEVALERANYDLTQATVTAPVDGVVVNLQLRPGMSVGGAGAGPVMTILEVDPESQRHVTAFFPQKNVMLIEPGHRAEVIFDSYPGRIFNGRVLNVIEMSGAGQLLPSGDLPDQVGTGTPTKFAVRIELDESEDIRIPGGANGQVAVYTDHVPIAAIPIMFLLRAQGWLNYLW